MPVASRTEISLLFKRLGWAAGKRAQEVAEKSLAQTEPSAKPGAGEAAAAGGEGSSSYSSAVDCGMRSGILVSFRLEHSTTPDSQRHFRGQPTSLLHSLFSW